MKRLALGLLSITLANSYACADTKFWVNKPEKIVLVAANPTLNVKLVKLEVDDDYYARLDVSLNYVSPDINSQVGNVLKDFDGYKLQRVVVEKGGVYNYQIPVLSIVREIDPNSGVEGPYIEDQIYLNKTKYKTVQAEIAAGHHLVQISGALVGTVPMMKVIEHKELSGSICEKLLGDDKTVSSTMTMLASVPPAALNSLWQFQYDSTRTSLIQDIKQNCFEVVQGTQINSFADILTLGLRAKQIGRNLVGETLKKSYDREDIPLSFETHQSGGDE